MKSTLGVIDPACCICCEGPHETSTASNSHLKIVEWYGMVVYDLDNVMMQL